LHVLNRQKSPQFNVTFCTRSTIHSPRLYSFLGE